ncbi:hypothetical protein ELD05_11355 [Caldicellulosiruptor changbaiensis]|uniref:Prolipoprotein diacylglyceryl transferase n=1 Tax=Caldicellulosiruptor changbaiensis TaxID=1222016 RepID=A0A3T0D877_9FIRM|nr:prolipoprotein diacylglyceryl transferase family protein [Caldicellulosiruptor changbaiensis]AZT91176.1 hypothetical protein ELD05_11355 [Caldicellulosiruptor changbaiensis]
MEVELHKSINIDSNIPFYNILGGIGFTIGVYLFIKELREKKISPNMQTFLLSIYIFSTLCGLILANIGNWFIKPGILKLPLSERFQKAGFTFYFGVIGFFVISYILLKLFKVKKSAEIYNSVIPSLLIFHSFGRIGCMFAGCCYGKIVDWKLFNIFEIKRFPTREVEAIFLFVLFLIMKYKVKSNRVLLYFLSYPIFRFFIEFARGDNRGVLITSYFSPSQLISIVLFLIAFIYLLHRKVIKRVKYYKEVLDV